MTKTTSPNGDIERCRQNPDKLDRARRQPVDSVSKGSDGSSAHKRPVPERCDEIPSQRIAPK